MRGGGKWEISVTSIIKTYIFKKLPSNGKSQRENAVGMEMNTAFQARERRPDRSDTVHLRPRNSPSSQGGWQGPRESGRDTGGVAQCGEGKGGLGQESPPEQ